MNLIEEAFPLRRGFFLLLFNGFLMVPDPYKIFHIMFAFGRKNGILILGNHEYKFLVVNDVKELLCEVRHETENRKIC